MHCAANTNRRTLTHTFKMLQDEKLASCSLSTVGRQCSAQTNNPFLILFIVIIIVRYLNSDFKIVIILRLFSDLCFILFQNGSASCTSLGQVEKVAETGSQ